MLKYENFADTNDVIRAYDFMGNKEAFIEGTIIDKGAVHTPSGQYMYEAYTIKIEKDGADWDREGDEGYIPFETSMDYDGRVEMIKKFVDDNDAEYNLALELMREFPQ